MSSAHVPRPMKMSMVPSRAVVPIVSASKALPVNRVLGSGFFVGDGAHLHVITARHVIEDNPLEAEQRYGIVFAGSQKIAIVANLEIRLSTTSDVAALKMPIASYLDEALRIPIAASDPALNEDVVCFEYSSSRIENKPEGGRHVSLEPYAHKGNIVRMYDSTFPAPTTTPVILTSFPALQGASGAPILVKTKPRRTMAAVGMMLANFERHLMPAQVLSIDHGDGEKEEVRYYLPHGKALARRRLAAELQAMDIPFESASIEDADDPGDESTGDST